MLIKPNIQTNGQIFMIQIHLIRYFEYLRDRCKDPANKAAIQAEIDRIRDFAAKC